MTILVTGATGLIGRHVVTGLVQSGAVVRGLSRRPQAAGLPAGAHAVGGDLDDPASLVDALKGVERVYLFTGGPLAHGFAELAREAGVRRVVVLSGLGSPDPNAVEQPLGHAGLEWTHLRPGAFAANALWQ